MSGVDYPAALDALLRRVGVVGEQVGERFPLYRDPLGGEWVSTRRGSWTGGFWAGWWWLRAAVGGEPADRAVALRWSRRLVPRAGDDTVTRAMTFWYGAGIGHRLCADPAARTVAIDGASALAASFDRRLGLVPTGTAFTAGREPSAGVDALAATVALLCFAADESPRRAAGPVGGVPRSGRHEFEDLAIVHAGRHCELLLDADGRIRPEVALRADGTAVLAAPPPQVWTRGQAWGVLGLAGAARCWGGEFTEAACRAARWWLDRVGTTVPPAVLGRPDAPLDTSAGAIVAAGLLELSAATGDDAWAGHAGEVTTRLVTGHLDADGVLRDGCYDVDGPVAPRHELVWGSFFLTAVLAALTESVRRQPW